MNPREEMSPGQSTSSMNTKVEVLVVGGGVAASTFISTFAQLRPNVSIGLVSPSPLLKEVSVVASSGRTLDQLQVNEVPLPTLPSLVYFEDSASGLNGSTHTLYTASGGVISYKYLCICTGARPLLLNNLTSSSSCSFIVGLRDTESVDSLTERLSQCRKILLVGNGGIATELVYELKNCHIIWAVKDQAISATFFDAATANFFVPKLTLTQSNAEQSRKSLTSRRFVAHSGSNAALGPDWSFMKCLQGTLQEKHVTVLYGCHVVSVTQNCPKPDGNTDSSSNDFPVTVILSNGQNVDCDLIISATGVTPNVEPFLHNNNFILSSDRALKVSYNCVQLSTFNENDTLLLFIYFFLCVLLQFSVVTSLAGFFLFFPHFASKWLSNVHIIRYEKNKK